MKKHTVAETPIDPTLPKVPVKIKGKEYFLCFDLAALADAEAHFLRQGVEVNLLAALPAMTLMQVRTLFPCALHKFQPSITFEEAQAMITPPVLYIVAAAIGAAWKESLPEPDQDPEEAVAEKPAE